MAWSRRSRALTLVLPVLVLVLTAVLGAAALAYSRIGRTPAELIDYSKRRLQGHPTLELVALPMLDAVGGWLDEPDEAARAAPFLVPPLPPRSTALASGPAESGDAMRVLVGPTRRITSLALACVDTALWDWRAQSQGLPLWQLLGGAQTRVPVYTTEGGWLNLNAHELVDQTLAAQAQGFRGAKIKVGRPHVSEDVARLASVRDAVGTGFDLMTDANQGFSRPEAARRAAAFAGLDLSWLEEPLPKTWLGTGNCARRRPYRLRSASPCTT